MKSTHKTPWKARVSCLVAVVLLLTVLPARATYDPETWSYTDSMSLKREGHIAVLLENGLVLVAGGFNGLYPEESELYDPATESWTPTGRLNNGRRYAAAALMSDGRVMVAGGRFYDEEAGEYQFLASTEIYDPATGLWTLTGAMNTGRQYHTLTLLNDGRLLVAGGYRGTPDFDFFDSAELYDPATGTWTPTASMGVKRASHTATLLPDGKVLVAGGSSGVANHATAELYDPDPDVESWTDTYGPMNFARQDHTATRLSDGQVLVAGGYYKESSTVHFPEKAELFNPVTGTWTSTDDMNEKRSSHTATRLSDGRVLVAGGYNGTTIASAEIFDPMAGSWTLTGPMKAIRRWHTSTMLPDGRVLVAGGHDDSLNYFETAELYLPSGANRLPVATNDDYITYENTPLEVPAVSGVLANDSDPDGDPLTATLDSPASHGSVTLNPNGSFVYTPTLGYAGVDGFTYQACDDADPPGCSAASVTITVSAEPVNLPPVAGADTYSTLENVPLEVPAGSGVLANDSDPDGDPLTATLDSPADHGSVTLSLDGSFVYTPTLDYVGSDGFIYQACDDADPPGCSTAAVALAVESVKKVIYLPLVPTGP